MLVLDGRHPELVDRCGLVFLVPEFRDYIAIIVPTTRKPRQQGLGAVCGGAIGRFRPGLLQKLDEFVQLPHGASRECPIRPCCAAPIAWRLNGRGAVSAVIYRKSGNAKFGQGRRIDRAAMAGKGRERGGRAAKNRQVPPAREKGTGESRGKPAARLGLEADLAIGEAARAHLHAHERDEEAEAGLVRVDDRHVAAQRFGQ